MRSKRLKKMKELEIKRRLIKWLLQNMDTEILIGSEYRFDFGARRADVVTLDIDQQSSAYEIKGSGDSLRKLQYQCEGYKLYFDKCFIVCEKENIHLVRKYSPRDVGILLLVDDSFKIIRKSKLFKRLSAVMLCSTIDSKHLRKLTGSLKDSKVGMCEKFGEIRSLNEVKGISRRFLRDRLEQPFRTFRKEIGQEISYDDLATLDRMPSSQLF